MWGTGIGSSVIGNEGGNSSSSSSGRLYFVLWMSCWDLFSCCRCENSAGEALLTKDNALLQETALKAVEQLVKARPPDLQEVCLEVVKVLLHLSDSFGLPEFSSLRQKALVTLAVECPQQVRVCVCICINKYQSGLLSCAIGGRLPVQTVLLTTLQPTSKDGHAGGEN